MNVVTPEGEHTSHKVVATAKLSSQAGASQGPGGSLSREFFFDAEPTNEQLSEVRKQMRHQHSDVYSTTPGRVIVDMTIRRVQ